MAANRWIATGLLLPLLGAREVFAPATADLDGFVEPDLETLAAQPGDLFQHDLALVVRIADEHVRPGGRHGRCSVFLHLSVDLRWRRRTVLCRPAFGEHRMPVAEFKAGTTMTRPGVGRAMGAYLFALLLLVALGWLVRPELALLDVGVAASARAGRPRHVGTAHLVVAGTPSGGSPAPAEPTEVAAPPLSDAAQASIAVLPLDNFSGTAEDGVVAQGFSAEIVRALSGVPDLRIVPFLQSAGYAGRKLTDVARELNVRDAARRQPAAGREPSPGDRDADRLRRPASRPGPNPTSATSTTCSRCSASWRRRSPSRPDRAT